MLYFVAGNPQLGRLALIAANWIVFTVTGVEQNRRKMSQWLQSPSWITLALGYSITPQSLMTKVTVSALIPSHQQTVTRQVDYFLFMESVVLCKQLNIETVM
jgi:hypothetical protein